MKTQATTHWNIKALILCHFFSALLLITFFFPWTRPFWQKLDKDVFFFFNNTLGLGSGFQLFWACADHRFHDWFADLIFLSFFAYYVVKKDEKSRASKTLECAIIVLAALFVYYFITQGLFAYYLKLERNSPTVDFPECYRLSHLFKGYGLKDASYASFPSGHASTALLFASLYGRLVKGKARLLAISYGIFLCLPRLTAGAHWLSDMVVGSGFSTLLIFAWIHYTPFSHFWVYLFPKQKIACQNKTC